MEEIMLLQKRKERETDGNEKAASQPDWKIMWSWMREIHHFARNMTKHQQNRTLTMGEMELLAVLAIEGEMAPQELRKATGMKSEAVSRSLRSLYSKGCIRRRKALSDGRSVLVSPTEEGEVLLKQDCSLFLSPLYCLERRMGNQTEEMVGLIARANRLYAETEERKEEN